MWTRLVFVAFSLFVCEYKAKCSTVLWNRFGWSKKHQIDSYSNLTLIMMAGGFLNTRTLNNFQVSALILGNVSIFFFSYWSVASVILLTSIMIAFCISLSFTGWAQLLASGHLLHLKTSPERPLLHHYALDHSSKYLGFQNWEVLFSQRYRPSD